MMLQRLSVTSHLIQELLTVRQNHSEMRLSGLVGNDEGCGRALFQGGKDRAVRL